MTARNSLSAQKKIAKAVAAADYISHDRLFPLSGYAASKRTWALRTASRSYLARLPWLKGCPRCRSWTARSSRYLWEYAGCGSPTSVTAGTIFAGHATPLPSCGSPPVITNCAGRASEVFAFYNDRGEEFKNGFRADRLSCHRFLANAFRLLLHGAA